MEGLSASVVLIGILLGVTLVVVFDVFCLLRLGTADNAHFLPRFAWAVLIVGASPIGGLVYLLAQRLRKRSPEPLAIIGSLKSMPPGRWESPEATNLWAARTRADNARRLRRGYGPF